MAGKRHCLFLWKLHLYEGERLCVAHIMAQLTNIYSQVFLKSSSSK